MSASARDTALASVSTFDEYETHIVVLSQRGKKAPELFRLNLTEELAAKFRSLAHTVGSALQQRTVVDYSVGRLLAGHEMVWLPASDAPLLESVRAEIAHPEDLPILDPKTRA